MVSARGSRPLDSSCEEALVSERDIAFDRMARNFVRDLHIRLQVVHAGVVVSALALHHQNADRDEEIARVLEHCVASVLAEQIDRTAELRRRALNSILGCCRPLVRDRASRFDCLSSHSLLKPHE
jgi:hypothetical protein